MTQFWDPRFWEKGVKSQFAYIFLFPQFSIFTSCSARASAHCRLVDCNLDHKKSPWRYRFSSSLPAFLACPQFSSSFSHEFHGILMTKNIRNMYVSIFLFQKGPGSLKDLSHYAAKEKMPRGLIWHPFWGDLIQSQKLAEIKPALKPTWIFS